MNAIYTRTNIDVQAKGAEPSMENVSRSSRDGTEADMTTFHGPLLDKVCSARRLVLDKLSDNLPSAKTFTIQSFNTIHVLVMPHLSPDSS